VVIVWPPMRTICAFSTRVISRDLCKGIMLDVNFCAFSGVQDAASWVCDGTCFIPAGDNPLDLEPQFMAECFCPYQSQSGGPLGLVNAYFRLLVRSCGLRTSVDEVWNVISIIGLLIEWTIAWIWSRMDFSICEDAHGSLKSETSVACTMETFDLLHVLHLIVDTPPLLSFY
jgi:hypothetical protein